MAKIRDIEILFGKYLIDTDTIFQTLLLNYHFPFQ